MNSVMNPGQEQNQFRTCLVRRIHFSAGHRYFRPDFSVEQNKAVYGRDYSEHGLGHNFILEAYVEGQPDPDTGMILNLKDLDLALKRVTDPLDHHLLNEDLDFFKSHVPSAENIARYCFVQLKPLILAPARLQKVRLFEGEELWVDYFGDLES